MCVYIYILYICIYIICIYIYIYVERRHQIRMTCQTRIGRRAFQNCKNAIIIIIIIIKPPRIIIAS